MGISTEKAFDMLPFVVEIIDKLDIKTEGKRIAMRLKEADPEKAGDDLKYEIGIEIIMYVGKNMKKVKEDFFGLVAVASDVDIETAKARPLSESIKILKDIFMDKELMDFFTTAMR